MIKERIEKELEREIFKTGKIGTETVSISLDITEKERDEFLNLDLEDNYWFEIEGNKLYISYTGD